jgi:formylglycine-generating enzyme required for sulfatase activity
LRSIRYINPMRHQHSAVPSFVLAFIILATAASVGIYRTHYGQSRFLEPLLSPKFEVPEPIRDLDRLRNTTATSNPNADLARATQVIAPSTTAFDADVLLSALPDRIEKGLDDPSIAQLHALLISRDKNIGELKNRALRLLDQYARGEQQLLLEPAAATLIAALDQVSGEVPNNLQQRMKVALHVLSESVEIDQALQAKTVDYKTLLARANRLGSEHTALPRWQRVKRKFRERLFADIQQLVQQGELRDARQLLDDSEIMLDGDRAQQDLAMAIQRYQLEIESTELVRFAQARTEGKLDTMQDSINKLQKILPDRELAPLQSLLSDARSYGEFAAGASFVDELTNPSANARPHGPQMIVVPIGQFVMGSPENQPGRKANEGPQRSLALSQGFAIARSEISVGEFANFIDSAGYVTEIEQFGGSAVQDQATPRLSNSRAAQWRLDHQGAPAKARDPVIHISFADAQAYAAWLSSQTGKRYRLPTEAEFEYALRGKRQTPYWWGESTPSKVVENLSGDGDRGANENRFELAFANYRDGFWGPAPIASFLPNAFGLYDLSGNVSEWVLDCWHESYQRAPEDFQAWVNPGCAQRVIRGGSWGSGPAQARSAARRAMQANTGSPMVGFRVVRELLP